MKFNFKKTCAICALTAIVASAGSALGKTAYPCGGKWVYGTTGAFGGGEVYSKYECYDDAYSYASVKNNKGKTASDTQNWDRAEASVKAYAFKTDYSYYNCWN